MLEREGVADNRIGFLRWDLKPGTLDSPEFNRIVNDAITNELTVHRWRTGWFIRREYATAQGSAKAVAAMNVQVMKLQTSRA